jgi:hypothetical protein
MHDESPLDSLQQKYPVLVRNIAAVVPQMYRHKETMLDHLNLEFQLYSAIYCHSFFNKKVGCVL